MSASLGLADMCKALIDRWRARAQQDDEVDEAGAALARLQAAELERVVEIAEREAGR